MADNSDNINTNAQNPKRVTVDGNSAEQFSIAEQIEADRYAKSNAAVKSKKRGLNTAKLSPPGTA